MMQLSVRLVPVDDATLVIALTGELDSTTRQVLAAFLDPLPRSPVKYVLVAAGDLWFCDLNGLEQLTITHRALLAKGGHLAVAEAQPPLRRLIGLMSEQTNATLPLFASMPEALAAAGVEKYKAGVLPRHLPRMRLLPHVPMGGHHRPGSRRDPPSGERPERPEPDNAVPQAEVGAPEPDPMSLIIYQSRVLRMQTLYHQQQLTQRLAVAAEARSLLTIRRQRCDDNLAAMRANLVDARSAMAPGDGVNWLSRRLESTWVDRPGSA